MALNTVQEIKRLLLLEAENQTMSDEDIEQYIEDAQQEMIAELKATEEVDEFVSVRGLNVFHTFFNMLEINKVVVDGVEREDYVVVDNMDGIRFASLPANLKVQIHYVPTNYKMLERAIAVVNIMTRLSPFQGDQISPVYVEWREKKKNFLKIISSKFGTGLYNG